MSDESRLVEGEEVESREKNESEDEEEKKEISVGNPEIEKCVKCELMSPDRNALPATSQNERKYLGSASYCMPLMCYKPHGVFVDYWLCLPRSVELLLLSLHQILSAILGSKVLLCHFTVPADSRPLLLKAVYMYLVQVLSLDSVKPVIPTPDGQVHMQVAYALAHQVLSCSLSLKDCELSSHYHYTCA